MLNSLMLALMLAVTIPPAPDNRISDQAGLLTPSETQALEKVFTDVKAGQKVNLGLLTLKEMDDTPKAIAVRTINYWQMSPDSVLVVISMNPRGMFLQPGTNLAYRFDESTSVGLLRDHMVPAFKAGRYGAGILNGFQAISQRLPGPAVTAAPNTTSLAEPRGSTQAVATPKDSTQTYVVVFGLVILFIGGFLSVRYLLRLRKERQAAEEEADRTFQRYKDLSAKLVEKNDEYVPSPSPTPSALAARPPGYVPKTSSTKTNPPPRRRP